MATDKNAEQVIALHGQKMSQIEIECETGIGRNIVRRILRDAGLVPSSSELKDRSQRVIGWYKDGYSCKAIVDKEQVWSPDFRITCVRRVLRKAGLLSPSAKVEKRQETAQEILVLYKRGETLEFICRWFNISLSTMYKILAEAALRSAAPSSSSPSG